MNFSNQANYTDADYSDLRQYNLVAIFGENHFNMNASTGAKIPLNINVCKSGELEISSLDKEKIGNDNISVYSDIKFSGSQE